MTPQQRAALIAIESAAVAIEASRAAVVEAARVLRASLEVAEPPAPEPPAPPPEPPAPSLPPLSLTPIGDGTRILAFRGYHETGLTYDRHQRLLYWSGPAASVTLCRVTHKSGAPYTPARTYTLLVNGEPAGVFAFADGQRTGQIKLDPRAFAAGWLRLEVTGGADGEVSVPWFAFNDQGQAKPDTMPALEGSHKIGSDPTLLEHAMTWESATYTPTPAPLARREYPPVTASTRVHAQCVTRPERGVNLSVPNVNKAGVVNSHWVQSYYWYHQLERWPMVPLLDGPRGVGTHPLTTHIEVGEGRRAPGGSLMHSFYFSDPWRISRGREDGSTETLVGYRHAGMASYYEDGAAQRTLELVGDWSAIPVERRGLWGVRSFCWDVGTLAVDEAAQPIAAEEGRLPHVVAPVMYVAEQRESGKGVKADGRVLRVEFNARAHGIPPKVTELATGLHGPWGIVDDGSRVIVSLRNASQIIAIDKASGAQTVLLSGDPAMARPHYTGIPALSGSLADRRLQAALAPECLKIQDGMLYVGSFAAECIKRIDLGSMMVDVGYLLPVRMTRQSWFVEFALSDGGFGPRGTVFAQTWGQTDHAGKYGTQPDWRLFQAHAPAAPWDKGQGYPSAVATFGGRLYTASSNLGINRYGAAQAGDMVVDHDTYHRGEQEYDALHGTLRWGSMGFGNHGHALPWGKSAALDHYLTAHDAPRS